MLILAMAGVGTWLGVRGAASPRSSPTSAPYTRSSTIGTKSASQFQWLIAYEALKAITDADPALARRYFDNSTTFVIEPPALNQTPYGVPVGRFRSFAALQQAISGHTINPAIRYLLYDNENWPDTPDDEKIAPAQSEARFATLAHENGYKVILAPAQNLIRRQPGFNRGASEWQQYLAMGFARFTTSVADIYEIQAQPYEGTAVFGQFVREAAAQARAARPGVVILAGVSTHRVQTANEMVNDVQTTRDVVDGYWLNIPDLGPKAGQAPHPDIALNLLRTLG
jgi:hypothetical protein